MTPNMGQDRDKPYDLLGKREIEILNLMAKDYSDRVIAEHLVVAYTTVKWYNRQIFNKLGVNNRHEAIEAAKSLNFLAAQEPATIPRHNLPSQITPFVGRETEIRELTHLLRAPASRLVTILAPGGMGKTRLALAAAEKLLMVFPDGIIFVPLAPVISSADIIATIASQSGYLFQRNSHTPAEQLLEYFSTQNSLLVLDNFEHLLDGAPFIVDLLKAAPELRVLVTSREKLNLSGETVYTLGGMVYPTAQDEDAMNFSAVQMFLQCAHRARPSFSPDGSFADIIRICELAGGMPLAIELAAAWVEVLPPAEIIAEITASLDFLSSSLRDLPERQRSVRAVFDSTWKRLSDQERVAFMKLSVFRGGCTRRAAQTVASVGLRTLTVLTDKALVSWSADSERYSVHELLRQYAADELERSGEAAAVHTAHCTYYGAAMAEREAHLKDRRQLEALKDISIDLDNVIAGWLWALQRGDDATAFQYIKTLGLFYNIRSRYQDALDLLTESLKMIEQRAQKADALLLGWVLAWHGHHLHLLWRYESSLAELERSLAIAREQNDRSLQAFCLHRYGFSNIGNKAESHLREALAISRELNDQYMTANCLNTLAFIVAKNINKVDEFERLTSEAAAIRREIGDLFGLGVSLNNLADYNQRMGKWDMAERYVLECLTLHRQSGNTYGIGMGLRNRIAQLLFRHDLEGAEEHIREGLALVRETGHRGNAIALLYQASLLHLLHGHYDEARAFAEESLEEGLRLVAADQFEALYPRIALGCALVGLRDYDAALPHLYAGLPHAEGGPADNVARRYVLTGIAHVDHWSGEQERALSLLSTVIHDRLSPPWWSSKEPLAALLLDELKTGLSADTYKNAWERGQQCNLETALQQLINETATQK